MIKIKERQSEMIGQSIFHMKPRDESRRSSALSKTQAVDFMNLNIQEQRKYQLKNQFRNFSQGKMKRQVKGRLKNDAIYFHEQSLSGERIEYK